MAIAIINKRDRRTAILLLLGFSFVGHFNNKGGANYLVNRENKMFGNFFKGLNVAILRDLNQL